MGLLLHKKQTHKMNAIIIDKTGDSSVLQYNTLTNFQLKPNEQNLRTLTLRKVLSDHFSLNNISELIPIINVALIYSFF